MASVKNYGIRGVGANVELGKQGPEISAEDANINMRDNTGTLTNVRGKDAIIADDLVTKRQLDQLDSILDLLVPEQPPLFANGTFVASGYTTGNSPVLASGAITDNTNGGTIPVTTAGANMSSYRGTSSDVDSTTLNDNGPGDSGTIQVVINGTPGASLAFTNNTGDSINSGGLLVSDNDHFPTDTPGFFQSFDVRLNNAPATVGWNRYKLTHTATGTTDTSEIYVLRDSLTAVPVTAGGTLAQSLNSSVFSSGVPHYDNSAQVTISGVTMTNLAGFTYRDSDPVVISDDSSGEDSLLNGTVTRSYADVGISTPIAAGTTSATALSAITVGPNQLNAHGEGQFRVQTRNVNGNSNTIALTPSVLHMAGSTSRVDEDNITVVSATSQSRVYLGAAFSGDTPAGPLPASPTAWVGSQDLTAVGFQHEAVVAGGLLRASQRDFSDGSVLPAGPDYSGKPGDQYITFAWNQAARSNFNVTINGTYSGMWVGLPGVSDNASTSPNALGGAWWDAFELYVGSGVPGRIGDSAAGCANQAAATGNSQTVQITFGTESSTNSTNNLVLVRIKLSAGDQINSISMDATA